MTDNAHDDETHPDDWQPVLVPFLLLCLAFGTIWFIGVNFNYPIEKLAGMGLARPPAHHSVATTPVETPASAPTAQ